jgi:hypothetical protein
MLIEKQAPSSVTAGFFGDPRPADGFEPDLKRE